VQSIISLRPQCEPPIPKARECVNAAFVAPPTTRASACALLATLPNRNTATVLILQGFLGCCHAIRSATAARNASRTQRSSRNRGRSGAAGVGGTICDTAPIRAWPGTPSPAKS
jgi:hypothetical protein